MLKGGAMINVIFAKNGAILDCDGTNTRHWIAPNGRLFQWDDTQPLLPYTPAWLNQRLWPYAARFDWGIPAANEWEILQRLCPEVPWTQWGTVTVDGVELFLSEPLWKDELFSARHLAETLAIAVGTSTNGRLVFAPRRGTFDTMRRAR